MADTASHPPVEARPRAAGATPAPTRAINGALVRWAAHVAFWGVYLLARTAAAEVAPRAGFGEGWGDFPFFLNRALVVASYAALTAGLLAGALYLKRRRSGRYVNLVLVLGGFAAMPIGQFIEELWPSVLAGEPRALYPIITYLFEMGWVLPLWGAAQALIGYHLEVLEQAKSVERARALAYDAQLRMLHYQINPHFLFNTLNAISTLVLEKRVEQAEAMIMRLSAFLRYTLDRDPNALAPLASELEAQRRYLEIERTRFGEKLAVSFDIEPGAERARAPSLILQPILENAIKYAITPMAEGGRILVTARREGDTLRLSVQDDGPGPNACAAARRASGVGLSNTRERLNLLYGARAGVSIEDRAVREGARGCLVTLWMPFEE